MNFNQYYIALSQRKLVKYANLICTNAMLSARKVFMDWQHLPTFLSVAKHGSLAKAARALSVNHSTIFRRVKALEKDVGGRLFERHQDGYILTTLGESVYGHASGVESAVAKLERVIMGQDQAPNGSIRITAPANIAEKFLPAYITSFRVKYPEIRIEILVSNQHFDLSRREADLAIRATKTPPDYLIATLLCEVPWALHVSKEFVEAFGQPKSLNEVGRFPLIGAEGEISLLPAFQWLDREFSEAVVTKANTLNVMSYLAEAGIGIALIPKDQLRQRLQTLDIKVEIPTSKWWLLTHPDLRNSERVKLFKAHMIQSIKEDTRLSFD